MNVNVNANEYAALKLKELFVKFPFLRDYLAGLDFPYEPELSFADNLKATDPKYFELQKSSREEMLADFEAYLEDIVMLFREPEAEAEAVTIFPGHGKNGEAEAFTEITIKRGETVAVVGPTGSGKSRFLEDIEYLAEGDTPTGRTVRVRTSGPGKLKKTGLIAELSQNMHYILDMSVEEFLKMHTDCFQYSVAEKIDIVRRVFETANSLSGEPFQKETPVTSLSGGQSRALMIADCAILSSAPIVLIDEIENAGIDRRKAMELLSGEDKIVLTATHDPVLILLADKRIVIDNGRVTSFLEHDEREDEVLRWVSEMDRSLSELRRLLRSGERVVGFGTRA